MNGRKEKSTAKKESPAQTVDRLLQRSAIGLFLLSLAYAMSATMYLVSDEVAGYMDRAQLALGILILLIVFPAFLKYLRLKYRRESECPATGGYIVEMFKKAGAKAFSLTFIFLIALELVAEKYLTDLPTPFFIKTILSFNLGVFSITFFRWVRDDDESDDDFDAEPGQ